MEATHGQELLQHINAQQEEYDSAEQYIAGDGHEHGQPGFRQCQMFASTTLQFAKVTMAQTRLDNQSILGETEL
ncbi:unnamed protein product [Arctogadus glacialis]